MKVAKASDLIQVNWKSEIIGGGKPSNQRISMASAMVSVFGMQFRSY